VQRIAFTSPNERDEWIRDRSPFVNAPGYRESLEESFRADA
jgi:hypothetical protein